jgi:hypothetical protein
MCIIISVVRYSNNKRVLRKSKIPMVCIAISPSKHVSYKRHQTWYVKPFHLRHQTRVHYQYHQIIMVHGEISPSTPSTCISRTPPDDHGTWSHFTSKTRHVYITNTTRLSRYVEPFHFQHQTRVMNTSRSSWYVEAFHLQTRHVYITNTSRSGYVELFTFNTKHVCITNTARLSRYVY